MNISVCGIDCDDCKCREEKGCGGCRSHEGNPFWGSCGIYACAAQKQLLHCGFCDDFPCQMLVDGLDGEGSDGVQVLTELMKNQSIVQSRCGLLCKSCGWREKCNCGGCIETNGHPFHGECPIAACCQKKNLTHCGQCDEMPCDQLSTYSCDAEHGDKPIGARLNVVRRWAGLKNSQKS
jgi:hypothetical protein